MRRRAVVVAFLAAAPVVAVSCINDPVAPGEELVGTYNLISIDGKQLPYSYVDAGQPATIVSRSLLVLKNGPFPTAYWSDSSIGTILIDGIARPRSAAGPLTFVNTGDTLVLTSSVSGTRNIPSFMSFIQDHQGGLRRLGPFAAELYHR
jgi:hypothetical protein